MSDVPPTEELERLVETRRTCGHDFLTDGCDDCANWRSIMRGWSVLRDTVSYESLAAEVLAGRKAQTQAREALAAAFKGYGTAHHRQRLRRQQGLPEDDHRRLRDISLEGRRGKPKPLA